MDFQLTVPDVEVEAELIRDWITDPAAPERVAAVGGWPIESNDDKWAWGDQFVGVEPHHDPAGEDWFDDLMICVRYSSGLFGDATIRGFLVREEAIGFKDLACVLGVEVPTATGDPVLLADEVAVWELIFPRPEGSVTDYTVAVLERIGGAVRRRLERVAGSSSAPQSEGDAR